MEFAFNEVAFIGGALLRLAFVDGCFEGRCLSH